MATLHHPTGALQHPGPPRVDLLRSSRSSRCPATRCVQQDAAEREPDTIENITKRKHLDDPVPVRYVYWLKDAVTQKFGDAARRRPADLARPEARDRHTLQLVIVAAECSPSCSRSRSACTRPLRQYSAFDYAATTFSFLGSRRRLLAGADAPGARHRTSSSSRAFAIFYTAQLSSVEPGPRLPLPASTGCSTCAAGVRARGRARSPVQPRSCARRCSR